MAGALAIDDAGLVLGGGRGLAARALASGSVRGRDGYFRPMLRRANRELVPVCGPARNHLVAGRRKSSKSGFSTDRHLAVAADHPGLHGVVVLGLSRQGVDQ